MSKKRRLSDGDDLLKSNLSHLNAEEVFSFFDSSRGDNVRYCIMPNCKVKYGIGNHAKTTSNERKHLLNKHLEEVIKKYPKPETEDLLTIQQAKSTPINQLGARVLINQKLLDRAHLLKFIADSDSYASLKSPGNQLFHKALFPDLMPPNKNIIKNGCHNLWKEVLKPKLKEYLSKEASGEFDLVSTLDIWTDDSNQSYIGNICFHL